MGLFDDIVNFVGEANAIKQEVSQFGADLAKEVVSDAKEISQTVADTADSIKSASEDIEATVKESVNLKTPSPDGDSLPTAS